MANSAGFVNSAKVDKSVAEVASNLSRRDKEFAQAVPKN